MGLLAGCVLVPMGFAMFAVLVALIVHEPLGLVLLVGLVGVCRALWRAHRAVLRRRERHT